MFPGSIPTFVEEQYRKPSFYYNDVGAPRYKPTGRVATTGDNGDIDQLPHQIISEIPHFTEYEAVRKINNSIYGKNWIRQGGKLGEARKATQNRYGTRLMIQKFKRNLIQFINQVRNGRREY